MPAIVAKQLNELAKVRVQTEGFRDATDVVMAPSVVICTRLAMQRYKVLTAGNLGTLVAAGIQPWEAKLCFRDTAFLSRSIVNGSVILAAIPKHLSRTQ
jgi:hypothetical protein